MKPIRRTSRRKQDSSRRLSSLVRQAQAAKLERDPKIDHPAQNATPVERGDWFDSAPIGFYTLDGQGRICQVNETGAKLLGFSSEWLLGRAFVVFVARHDVQTFLDVLTDSARHPHSQMIEVDLLVGNRTPPVQIWITTLDRRPVLHQLSIVDLTDLRRTELLLQESMANWYSLVHNAPDTIPAVDKDGRVSFINKPLWGYSAAALINTSLLDFIADTERQKVRQCLDQTFRLNKRVICEVTGVGGDLDKWYQFSFGSPHGFNPNAETGPSTTTLIIREISDSKHAEASLRTSGEQLRDVAARLEAVREEERTRVAREIHDELGQALTALKMDLSWLQIKSRTRAETAKKLKGCIKQVDDTIESVRRISYELRPSVLDNLGIIPAIDWQISQFRARTGIRTSFKSNAEDLHLSMEVSVALFRVVQEALTNIMRHARSSRVHVNVIANEKEIRISIEDNGIGMPQRHLKGSKSLGIIGMKERMFQIGGEFNCSSEIGKGTWLEIKIPVGQ
jgi:two-component system sensor histidine kinase UhpB